MAAHNLPMRSRAKAPPGAVDSPISSRKTVRPHTGEGPTKGVVGVTAPRPKHTTKNASRHTPNTPPAAPLRRGLTDGGIATTTRNEEASAPPGRHPPNRPFRTPCETRPDDKGAGTDWGTEQAQVSQAETAPGVSVTEGPKGTDPTLVGGHTTTPQRSKDLCGGVTDRRGGWLPVWNSPDRPSK